MPRDKPSRSRRKVLKSAGILGVPLATPHVVSSAKAESGPDISAHSTIIPERLARVSAKERVKHNSQREEFSEFNPSGLAEPELFYSVSETKSLFGSVSKEYVPSAWVYPIKNNGTEVGHIAVSARPESPGVIKCGTGKAPQNRPLENQVLNNGRSLSSTDDVRYIYNNPMSFCIEVDSTYVDLKSGHTLSIDSVVSPELSSGQDRQRNVKMHPESRSTSFEPLDTGNISGVPNWNGKLCGYDWVGCVPASSAMCIGYHEGMDSRNCDLMWELHEKMGTNDEGVTQPPGFFKGITNYDSSYIPGIEVAGRRSRIKQEIDSGRPCIVGYWGDRVPSAASTKPSVKPNKIKEKIPDSIWNKIKDKTVGHAETVVGYEEGNDPIWNPTQPTLYATTYDTYGDVNELALKSTTVEFYVFEIRK